MGRKGRREGEREGWRRGGAEGKEHLKWIIVNTNVPVLEEV